MIKLEFDISAETSTRRLIVSHCEVDLSMYVDDEKDFFNKYKNLYEQDGYGPLYYKEICKMVDIKTLEKKITRTLFPEVSELLLFSLQNGRLWYFTAYNEYERCMPKYSGVLDPRLAFLGKGARIHEC